MRTGNGEAKGTTDDIARLIVVVMRVAGDVWNKADDATITALESVGSIVIERPGAATHKATDFI